MKFEVNGTEYEFVQSPTFGEARAIEKVTGQPFASFGDQKSPTVDFMQALVWISMKRVDPEVTFDDLDDLDMGLLASLQEEAAPEVPTEADAEAIST